MVVDVREEEERLEEMLDDDDSFETACSQVHSVFSVYSVKFKYARARAAKSVFTRNDSTQKYISGTYS